MNDLISRQAAIDAVVNTVSKIGLHDDSEVARYGATFRQHEIIDIIEGMPPAQPEIKPIDYQDCANAMLRMWMDEVVTDGEYNRIMDKLNAFWRTRNERSD